MRCRRIEKWISDKLDGELSGKKIERLEVHLQRCSSCRAYYSRMKEIQADTESVKIEDMPEAYLKDFSPRLKAKLNSLGPPVRIRLWNNPAVRWGFGTACAVLLAGIALVIFFPGVLSEVKTERYVFSLDDAVREIRADIGGDEELEELFNVMILASIQDTLQDTGWKAQPGFDERIYEETVLIEGELESFEQENNFDLET